MPQADMYTHMHISYPFFLAWHLNSFQIPSQLFSAPQVISCNSRVTGKRQDLFFSPKGQRWFPVTHTFPRDALEKWVLPADGSHGEGRLTRG